MNEDDKTAKTNGRSRAARSVTLIMQTDLFKHGYERAMESGALTPQRGDEQAIDEHARAMARQAECDDYDPTKHAHDEMLDGEYRKNLADRADAEQAAKFAEADVAQREEEAARDHAGSPPPKPSQLFVIAAVVATMITVGPTLHDTVFLMDDDFISWSMSIACGLFLGLLIAVMIVGDTDAPDHRTVTNWIGLGAGILVSLALGALRMGAATNAGDYIFAIGMTVLELGIVLALEGVATRRRAAMSRWSVRNEAAEKTTAALDAAKNKLDRWKERLRDLNQAIGEHIEYVEDRALRSSRIDELEATACKAARDGYLAGIAHNRGRVLGTGRKG
jgi:hypothetical protein